MSDIIKLKSAIDGFEFGALHAEAQGARKGGVIVIQEIFGIDHYVREDVARWAAAGYEAIAPSMFDRQEPGYIAGHDEAGFATGRQYAMANGMDNAVSDVQACIDALKDKGPVYLVGYCYGGTVCWLAAGKTEGLSAISAYYGGGIPGALAVAPKVPIICNFGRTDAHIPADETKAAITAAYPDVPVYIYEQSGHGFNNEGGPNSDAADAELARERTLALFAANA